MSEVNNYAAPRSLDEAADILRAGNVTILAGGTDVMPQMKAGKLTLQPTLMNIRRIAELVAGEMIAGLPQRIEPLAYERAVEQFGDRRQGADPHDTVCLRNAAQLRNAPDVHQRRL